jgi:hypothetical protein
VTLHPGAHVSAARLAEPGSGHGRDDVDAVGYRGRRQSVRTVLAQVGERGWHAGPDHYLGADVLSVPRMGEADDHGVEYLWVLEQRRLHRDC